MANSKSKEEKIISEKKNEVRRTINARKIKYGIRNVIECKCKR